MSETTAFGLFGPARVGPWGDAKSSPMTLARLRENSVPSWVLSDLPLAVNEPLLAKPVVLIPSRAERILDDLVVVAAALLLEDESVRGVLAAGGVDLTATELDFQTLDPRPTDLDDAVASATKGALELTLAYRASASFRNDVSRLEKYGLRLTTLAEQ